MQWPQDNQQGVGYQLFNNKLTKNSKSDKCADRSYKLMFSFEMIPEQAGRFQQY